jgi:hypothetical protein
MKEQARSKVMAKNARAPLSIAGLDEQPPALSYQLSVTHLCESSTLVAGSW